MVEQNNLKVQHIYRKGNQLADAIANRAYSKLQLREYKQFVQLPTKCRRILTWIKLKSQIWESRQERLQI